MKRVILFYSFFSLAAFAQDREARTHKKLESFRIEESSKVRTATIQVKVLHSTKDSCNHFSMEAKPRQIENLGGGEMDPRQDYFVELSIISTDLACNPLEKARRIPLEAAFEIFGQKGMIDSTLVVPAGAKVSYTLKHW